MRECHLSALNRHKVEKCDHDFHVVMLLRKGEDRERVTFRFRYVGGEKPLQIKAVPKLGDLPDGFEAAEKVAWNVAYDYIEDCQF